MNDETNEVSFALQSHTVFLLITEFIILDSILNSQVTNSSKYKEKKTSKCFVTEDIIDSWSKIIQQRSFCVFFCAYLKTFGITQLLVDKHGLTFTSFLQWCLNLCSDLYQTCISWILFWRHYWFSNFDWLNLKILCIFRRICKTTSLGHKEQSRDSHNVPFHHGVCLNNATSNKACDVQSTGLSALAMCLPCSFGNLSVIQWSSCIFWEFPSTSITLRNYQSKWTFYLEVWEHGPHVSLVLL